jgi:hypothetical protein
VYSAGRPRELFLHVGFHGFTALQQEQDGLISDAFMKHSVNALVDDPAPLHASMGASKGNPGCNGSRLKKIILLTVIIPGQVDRQQLLWALIVWPLNIYYATVLPLFPKRNRVFLVKKSQISIKTSTI